MAARSLSLRTEPERVATNVALAVSARSKLDPHPYKTEKQRKANRPHWPTGKKKPIPMRDETGKTSHDKRRRQRDMRDKDCRRLLRFSEKEKQRNAERQPKPKNFAPRERQWKPTSFREDLKTIHKEVATSTKISWKGFIALLFSRPGKSWNNPLRNFILRRIYALPRSKAYIYPVDESGSGVRKLIPGRLASPNSPERPGLNLSGLVSILTVVLPQEELPPTWRGQTPFQAIACKRQERKLYGFVPSWTPSEECPVFRKGITHPALLKQ